MNKFILVTGGLSGNYVVINKAQILYLTKDGEGCSLVHFTGTNKDIVIQGTVEENLRRVNAESTNNT